MILYGRTLSPFVRRIAIMCALQGHAVERRDILVIGEDFDRLRAMNPVGRVPVLELDDGTRLIDSVAIGDWLDETAPNGRRFLPERGTARRDAFQRLALANGVAEKAVALVYERNRRPEEFHWKDWQQRLVNQIRGGLDAIEAWIGERPADAMDAGDLAAAITYQFIELSNPWVLSGDHPRLAAYVEQAMALTPVAETKPAA